ncbi:MAG: hypothetical protein EZS28_038716 [Streblomastix strix]|uniref:SPRY domain-containing protein n=1 Tax=Streblomastix strix TaxID=222440 RepID=A0A5J4U5B1_9EUKA|nr:MAG: hypothetical protein EZS28_038716 [Streblomastix strix]
MLVNMLNPDPDQRPKVKELLESDLMKLIEKIENEKENKNKIQELVKEKQIVIRERDKVTFERDQALNEKQIEMNEKERIQTEISIERKEKEIIVAERDIALNEKQVSVSEKVQYQQRAECAETLVHRLQEDIIRLENEVNREKEEKIKALTERDREKTDKEKERDEKLKEKTRADLAFVEVLRLSIENNQLKQQLERIEQIQASPKVQLNPNKTSTQKILVMPSSKPKQISPGTTQTYEFSVENDFNNFLAVNTTMNEGIYYFEICVDNHVSTYNFAVGIFDASDILQFNEYFKNDENKDKIVSYTNAGFIDHFNHKIYGNQSFRIGQRVGAEVNLDSNPRQLTFFVDGQEQKNCVINIPRRVRFWAYLQENDTSDTRITFEKHTSSLAHGVEGQKTWKWGKQWKQ